MAVNLWHLPMSLSKGPLTSFGARLPCLSAMKQTFSTAFWPQTVHSAVAQALRRIYLFVEAKIMI